MCWKCTLSCTCCWCRCIQTFLCLTLQFASQKYALVSVRTSSEPENTTCDLPSFSLCMVACTNRCYRLCILYWRMWACFLLRCSKAPKLPGLIGYVHPELLCHMCSHCSAFWRLESHAVWYKECVRELGQELKHQWLDSPLSYKSSRTACLLAGRFFRL